MIDPITSRMFGLINSVWRAIKADASTHAMVIAANSHNEIHEGNHYFVTHPITLDDTDILEILITTPDNDIEPHIKIVTVSTAELQIDFYEDSDRIGGAPTITPTNNNRRSLNTSILTINGTISGGTTDGDIIASFLIGATGTTPAAGNTGGGNRSEDEIILKKNTKYLLRYTSGSDGNNINNLASWYEHTPLD